MQLSKSVLQPKKELFNLLFQEDRLAFPLRQKRHDLSALLVHVSGECDKFSDVKVVRLHLLFEVAEVVVSIANLNGIGRNEGDCLSDEVEQLLHRICVLKTFQD